MFLSGRNHIKKCAEVVFLLIHGDSRLIIARAERLQLESVPALTSGSGE